MTVSLIRPPVDNDEIERLMDKHDTVALLLAIAEVLQDKAEHLRTDWQDEDSAELFDEAAVEIGKAVERVEVLIG
jgi:hypothetical protein